MTPILCAMVLVGAFAQPRWSPVQSLGKKSWSAVGVAGNGRTMVATVMKGNLWTYYRQVWTEKTFDEPEEWNDVAMPDSNVGTVAVSP